jgi:predicted dehydrogenase
MKVGIIGGAERNELQYRRVAEEAGHELEFHSGKLSSCGSSSLEALVKRCDLVVIATDTNSHAAVRTARSLMRARGTAPLLIRRLGVSRLAELLQATEPALVAAR